MPKFCANLTMPDTLSPRPPPMPGSAVPRPKSLAPPRAKNLAPLEPAPPNMPAMFPGRRNPSLARSFTSAPLVSSGMMTSKKTFIGCRRM